MSITPTPTASLSRFLHGIFEYHRDKGVPVAVAKAKMYDEALEAIYKMMKDEREIPDHMMAISATFMRRALNMRGVQLKKQVEKLPKDDPQIPIILEAMRDIKAAVDATEHFIKSYKGITSKEAKQHGTT
jgi:deoxyadenosine/deoxycytidine kinase